MVEILVVVGLFGLLVAVGALIGLDSIGRGNVSSERDTLVTLLTGARTAALANVHAKPHGVYVDSTHFTAFEGTSFAAGSNKREVGRDANIAITPDPAEVVFGQLRANIASPVSITLSNGANSQVIDINTEGRIEW